MFLQLVQVRRVKQYLLISNHRDSSHDRKIEPLLELRGGIHLNLIVCIIRQWILIYNQWPVIRELNSGNGFKG